MKPTHFSIIKKNKTNPFAFSFLILSPDAKKIRFLKNIHSI